MPLQLLFPGFVAILALGLTRRWANAESEGGGYVFDPIRVIDLGYS